MRLPGSRAMTFGDVAAGVWLGLASIVLSVVARRRSAAAAARLASALVRVLPRERGGDLSAVARRERVARRLTPPMWTCVGRSLALAELLRREGWAPTIRIGVREGDPLNAHAWVELDGAPFLERGDPRVDYQAFPLPVDLRPGQCGSSPRRR